ncbi:hypothetical protein RRG08_058558 [Elysia crispata]|uniref:Uncharacterized protein n=1 Tax=Elysia crispata TaxID=231223 RepID=A0AAE1CMT0_9GAST|nr:hypothetical protein RRG08_058558 [Elysia crispata]
MDVSPQIHAEHGGESVVASKLFTEKFDFPSAVSLEQNESTCNFGWWRERTGWTLKDFEPNVNTGRFGFPSAIGKLVTETSATRHTLVEMAASSTVRLNPSYEDNSVQYQSERYLLRGNRLVILLVVAVLLAFVFGLLIGRFALSHDQSSEEKLGREADEDISKKIMDAIDPKEIEDTLRILSKKPHIAGRQGDFDLVKYIQTRFRDHGLEVSTTPYDALLSYPNDQVANSVRILDADGEIVYDSVRDESDVSHLEDVVPPFNAYAPARKVEGQLVYVNYGRVEDYDWLRSSCINVTGHIVLAKLGQIFRGDIVDIAADNGAVGVVTFPDPADYAGVRYGDNRFAPEAWWMPPDGVQRGTVFTGFSDPLTPGYPANNLAYRYPEDKADLPLPQIPSQPISYGAAFELLRQMTGRVAPNTWQGGLNLTYRLGPGFNDTRLKLELNVTNKNERAKVENVFGIIRGEIEPDRYVLVGNHRDAWIYGALDPSSGTVVMMEIARVMGQMVKKGTWRPRRSIMFCSWGAEEYGLIGSAEWVEQYVAVLRERAVGYLNIDIALRGNDTVRVLATPLMYNIAYEASQKVRNPNPAEIQAGRATVYDTWQHVTAGSSDGKPRIGGLGSGSDYAPLLQKAGITALDIGYTYDTKKYQLPSYPLYHTEYETFDIVKNQYDKGFEFHAALSRFMGEMARNLADSLILPFNLDGYSEGLKLIKRKLDASDYGVKLKVMLDNYGKLDEVIAGFETDINDFRNRLEKIDKNNPYAVREMNDQILLLEKAFLISEGLPTRPSKKHILFAENSNDVYAESTFPGLVDLLFKIDSAPAREQRWERVKRHFSAILHTIQTAGATLRDVSGFMTEEL